MNTPVPPERGSVRPLYGRRRLSINHAVALAALAGLLGGASAEPSAPPLTELTQRSGGAVDADRASVAFDAADLAFEVLPEKQVLNGVATLTFSARAAITRLALDLDRDLAIESIAIDGRKLKRSAWSNPEGRLTITLPHPVPAGGKITARIAYGGKPHVAVNPPWDDGMVWSKTPDGKTWFATTAEGYGCDLFWPCLDFPEGEPAVATLHITVPAGLKAPSNGVLLGVETLPDGRTRWNWRARNPNTYAIALNVGPYEELSASYKSRFGNVIPLHFWYLPGNTAKAQALFAEFAPALDFFESTIGPYPFGDEKVGVVETPHKGMEHQTINAYGNGYAKAPEGFDWLFHHELSHEWFGNQLTAANWDDYWLHEGFASYMQPLYGHWREGDARYAVMLETHRNHITNAAPIVRDRILTEEEVYEPAKGGAGTDIYYKAAWMLHTLRWLIGDAAFFESTRRLVYGRPDPKPGNFTPRFGSTREFQAIVQRVTGRDFGWFFDAYLRQRALPELVVKRVGGALTLRWNTTAPFPMPIEVGVGDEMRKIALSGEPQTIAVGEDARVVVDPRALVLRRSVAVEAYQAGLARAK